MITRTYFLNRAHRRCLGVHNPFDTDFGKAQDPHINRDTLWRLLCHPSEEVRTAAAQNVLGRKVVLKRMPWSNRTILGDFSVDSSNLLLHEHLLSELFPPEIKERTIDKFIASIQETKQEYMVAENFGEIVLKSGVSVELKKRFLKAIIDQFYPSELILGDDKFGLFPFFEMIAGLEYPLIMEINRWWDEFKPPSLSTSSRKNDHYRHPDLWIEVGTYVGKESSPSAKRALIVHYDHNTLIKGRGEKITAVNTYYVRAFKVRGLMFVL